MSGGINADRWPGYVADIFRVLRRGGWCQMVEIYYNAQSDNGTLTDSKYPFGRVSRLNGSPWMTDWLTDWLDDFHRPRPSCLVVDILAKYAAVQESEGSYAIGESDEASRVRRSGRTAPHVAPERLVER